MFLLVNLSEKDTIHLAVFDAETIEHKSYPLLNRELLSCIDSFLQEKSLNKTDVHGIMTVVGVGAFTSTRIGTTVANTFAFVLGIPVLGISVDEVGRVQELIPKLLATPRGQYVSATYSGEANIGKIKNPL